MIPSRIYESNHLLPRSGLIITFLLNLLLLTGAQICLGKEAADSSVEFLIWDFGFLPQKSEVNHIFYIRNINEKPATVSRIRAGCSCTSVSKINEPIMPGDSAGIEVTFKSGRYRGEVKKTTKIYFDHRDEPTYFLKILARVYKDQEEMGPIRVDPPRFQIKASDPDIKENDLVLKITNGGRNNLRVESLYYPLNFIGRIQIPEEILPGGTAKFRFYLTDGLLEISDAGLAITLVLSGQDTTIITVPIEIK